VKVGQLIDRELASARKRWPNEPLVVLQIDGDVIAGPVGHIITLTTEHCHIVVLRIDQGNGR
jgi:hypothetical protein